MLARRSNFALGRRPSVRTALTPPAPCTGTSRLREIFKRAAHQFGLSWKVLAAITEVESAHGCNMGPLERRRARPLPPRALRLQPRGLVRLTRPEDCPAILRACPAPGRACRSGSS